MRGLPVWAAEPWGGGWLLWGHKSDCIFAINLASPNTILCGGVWGLEWKTLSRRFKGFASPRALGVHLQQV